MKTHRSCARFLFDVIPFTFNSSQRSAPNDRNISGEHNFYAGHGAALAEDEVPEEVTNWLSLNLIRTIIWDHILELHGFVKHDLKWLPRGAQCSKTTQGASSPATMSCRDGFCAVV